MTQTVTSPDEPARPEALACVDAYRGAALKLLGDGLALAEISHALEVSPRLLLHWFHELGLAEPPPRYSSLSVELLVLDALHAGTPLALIAHSLGLSLETVRVWAREEGLCREPLLPRPFLFVRDAALAMLRAGAGVLDVARHLHIDSATVRDWARRAHLKPSRRAERAAAERAVPLLRRRLRVNR